MYQATIKTIEPIMVEYKNLLSFNADHTDREHSQNQISDKPLIAFVLARAVLSLSTVSAQYTSWISTTFDSLPSCSNSNCRLLSRSSDEESETCLNEQPILLQ